MLGQPGPSVAAGHGFFIKHCRAYVQRPGEMVCDGLTGLCAVMDDEGQPCAEAEDITGQSDAAVTPFPVLCGVWQ